MDQSRHAKRIQLAALKARALKLESTKERLLKEAARLEALYLETINKKKNPRRFQQKWESFKERALIYEQEKMFFEKDFEMFDKRNSRPPPPPPPPTPTRTIPFQFFV
jgi:hypothetical protein